MEAERTNAQATTRLKHAPQDPVIVPCMCVPVRSTTFWPKASSLSHKLAAAACQRWARGWAGIEEKRFCSTKETPCCLQTCMVHAGRDFQPSGGGDDWQPDMVRTAQSGSWAMAALARWYRALRSVSAVQYADWRILPGPNN
jgi:hypothetical protein